MRAILLLSMGLFLAGSLQAQGFTGHWAGMLTPQQGGKGERVRFEIDIQKDAAGAPSGEILLLRRYKGKYYLNQSSWKGTWTPAGDLQFTETGVINAGQPADPVFVWCLKSGTLHLIKAVNKQLVTGTVAGTSPAGACSSGEVELYRVDE